MHQYVSYSNSTYGGLPTANYIIYFLLLVWIFMNLLNILIYTRHEEQLIRKKFMWRKEGCIKWTRKLNKSQTGCATKQINPTGISVWHLFSFPTNHLLLLLNITSKKQRKKTLTECPTNLKTHLLKCYSMHMKMYISLFTSNPGVL